MIDGRKDLLQPLRHICRHFIDDHIDERGVIWNQNFDHETPVDYSTVDAPMVHLMAAGKLLAGEGDDLGHELLGICRQQAEHLLARGFDFPTEGEPCSDEGSIACAAWALARSYNELQEPDGAWLSLAQDLLAYHNKMRLSGVDIRLDGSSVRFWETMYESNDWGPSINAGHGWSLWHAHAHMEVFRATSNFEDLWQAWRATLCVASKMKSDGSFPPCFTPDPIPALPHDDAWGGPARRHEGRMSSAMYGPGYPECSSMSSMHLFLIAPRLWYHTSGWDPKTGRVVNGRIEGDRFIPHTALPCQNLCLGSTPNPGVLYTGLAHEVMMGGELHTTSIGELQG